MTTTETPDYAKHIAEQVASWPPLTDAQLDRLRILLGGEGGAPLPRLDNAPPPVRKCALYRYFDADGELLYVGISTQPEVRGRAHSRRSAFMEFVSTQNVEWFDSEDEALTAEADAIKAESPLFNRTHATEDRDERLFKYLADKNAFHLMRLP